METIKKDAELSFRVLAIYRFLGWSGSHHPQVQSVTVGGKSIATDCTFTASINNIGQKFLKIN